MNDKCAAGTGRFLEGIIKALENRLKCKIIVSDSAQENGAIGAAVLSKKL